MNEHGHHQNGKAWPAPPSTPPPKKKRRWTKGAVRADLAKRGDFVGLFRSIAAADSEIIIIRSDEFARLFRVVRTKARQSPLAVVDEILSYGVGLLTYISLRQANHLEHLMRRTDERIARGSETALPAAITDTMVPAFFQTLSQIAELGERQVFIERQRELTRAKRLENDRSQAIYGAAKRSQVAGESAKAQTTSPAVNPCTSEADLEEFYTSPNVQRMQAMMSPFCRPSNATNPQQEILR